MQIHGQKMKARVAAVSGVLAFALLGAVPTASAASSEPAPSIEGPQLKNWESYLSGALTGFQSRRWADESYSQIQFTGCDTSRTQPGPDESTHIDLRQDISLAPDRSWGIGKATNCFDGPNNVSSGEWNGLAKGNHFFEIVKINSEVSCCSLSVNKVYVDTTYAD